jgi:hypothetical protein
MRRLSVVLGLLLALASAGSLFAQRADRGIITGVVTDPSGAAVPGANVTIINENTGVQTPVSTTGAGNYGSPPLILGKYTVRVEKEGFKTFVRSGIILDGGVTYRQDATLELGAIAQTVEVKAASEMINVSSAEVGHSINEKYYQDLPVVMGADIRLAESLLHAQPGYVPMQPNGDAMFRGSQFHSRINGGQVMATENWMDGAAFGYARGHQQTQESAVPIDSVREMKVINSSFSAQYGHTSGAFIEYVSKSGSNEFHGSVYEYLGNSSLNARRFFEYNRKDLSGNELPGTAIRPSKNNDYGFTIGGPIKKDKTFFFNNLGWMKLRQVVSSGFINRMPTAALKTGNFSSILDSATVLGQDALGRDIHPGQIFNPGTQRMVTAGQVDPVTGVVATATGWVRDPYPGNIIPANDPLRSTVAANWLSRLPDPDLDTMTQNNVFGGGGDPNKILDVTNWLIRVDHTFGPSLKSSTSYWMNERPAIRKCGSIQACDTPSDPRSNSAANTNYISDGFVQRIANRNIHQQFDWVIRPTLFNHTTIAYDRWYMGGWSLSDGAGWHQLLGIKGLPALNGTGGPPNITLNGGRFPYAGNNGTIGTQWLRGFEAVNRWQFADDLTYIHGKHTIKAGFEWRWHEFNHSGWARSGAGNWTFNARNTAGISAAQSILDTSGDAIASLILGQIWSSSFFQGLDHVISEKYWSPWINDEIKVTDRLTLNFGLRFDYQTPRTERHNRMSNFDPKAMNPVGVPGAMVFASASNRSFEKPDADSWGPRAAFAYKLSSKDVIRGGYGIYYSGVQYDMWIGSPTTGYEATSAVPNLTSGLFPAGCTDLACTNGYAWWDNPFPTAFIKNPPFLTADVANNTSPISVSEEGLRLPRYQNWSFTWERQLSNNMLLDISYVGNHGTRLISNRTSAGHPLHNENNPSILQYGALLGQSITAPAVQALAPVQAMPVDPGDGLHKPYAGFGGNLAQALRPFPQYQDIAWRNLTTGSSVYHSLQAKLDKRFASGLQFRLAYVWSKLMVIGPSDSGNGNDVVGGGIQNPVCTRSCEKAVSADDVPHTFILAYTYQLPFGRGKKFGANAHPVVDKIIGGWGLSGIQRYQSGRPLGITMSGGDVTAYLFSWVRRPNKVADSAWSGGKFDPATNRYLDKAAYTAPGQFEFGNAPRLDSHVRTFPIFNEDINLYKDTFVKAEQWKVRFEAQFGNIFNRTFFCNPNTSWTSGDFGKVTSQCNIPRRIQFGLRFEF